MPQSTVQPKILIPIANACHAMEIATLYDCFNQAGYQVVMASADSDSQLTVNSFYGMPLVADTLLVNVADESFDAIVLAGAQAACQHFCASPLLLEVLAQHHYEGKWVAAHHCLPAQVLLADDLFAQDSPGYRQAIMTCTPSLQDRLSATQWRPKRVVVDKNHRLITSQGPGSVLELAMELIIALSGKVHAAQIAEQFIVIPNLHYQDIGKNRL